MGTSTHRTDVHEFINCEFEYECPKNWFELDTTNKAGIKHCVECKKDVHLCITQDELAHAIKKNFCVAYFLDPPLSTRFKLSREKCEVNKQDSRNFRRATLGIPKGYKGLDKLLENAD